MDPQEDDVTEIVIDQEDEVQDYKFLNKQLPKMGEKDFEPDGTHDQTDKISESKAVMYQALSQEIKIHDKQVLEGIYLPEEHSTLILNVRGNYFKDLGSNGLLHQRQIITLNTIETLYLLERGSLVLYLGNDKIISYIQGMINSFNIHELWPINLQYFYNQLSSFDIYKYQVFAYLKRLGYLVKDYDSQFIPQILPDPKLSWFQLKYFNRASVGINVKKTHFTSYTQILKQLCFIPSYKTYGSIEKESVDTDSQYQIHYNVWKPRSLFSKKAPPKPDFQVCIVEEFPKLKDIHALFNKLNYELETLDFSNLDQRQKDQKLKYGSGRSIILATIDNGVSFINLSEVDFKLKSNDKINGFIH